MSRGASPYSFVKRTGKVAQDPRVRYSKVLRVFRKYEGLPLTLEDLHAEVGGSSVWLGRVLREMRSHELVTSERAGGKANLWRLR